MFCRSCSWCCIHHWGLHYHLRWLGIHLLRWGAIWLLHRRRTVGLLGHHLLLRLRRGKERRKSYTQGKGRPGAAISSTRADDRNLISVSSLCHQYV
jgi:hypothetical protein